MVADYPTRGVLNQRRSLPPQRVPPGPAPPTRRLDARPDPPQAREPRPPTTPCRHPPTPRHYLPVPPTPQHHPPHWGHHYDSRATPPHRPPPPARPPPSRQPTGWFGRPRPPPRPPTGSTRRRSQGPALTCCPRHDPRTRSCHPTARTPRPPRHGARARAKSERCDPTCGGPRPLPTSRGHGRTRPGRRAPRHGCYAPPRAKPPAARANATAKRPGTLATAATCTHAGPVGPAPSTTPLSPPMRMRLAWPGEQPLCLPAGGYNPPPGSVRSRDRRGLTPAPLAA
ncbi:unnamed protein product [Boreogadus saida]